MNKDLEKRYMPFDKAEIRAVRGKDGEPDKIIGYFAKFGTFSEEMWGFRETIEKGFFREALKGSDVVDLFNHDPNLPLGRESAKAKRGSLKVWEDDKGLAYELIPVDTTAGRDMVTLVESGVIKGNSFGFTVKRHTGDRWEEREGVDLPVRVLVDGGCEELIDGSQVTFPAYSDTEVAKRSLDKYKEEIAQRGVSIEDENLEIELLSMRARRL